MVQSKTLSRWKVTTIAVIPLSVVCWWQVPKIVNSNFWALGFVLEAGLIAGYGYGAIHVAAKSIQAWNLIEKLSYKGHSFSYGEALDLLPISDRQLQEAEEIHRANKELSFSEVLRGVKS